VMHKMPVLCGVISYWVSVKIW